jgi:nitrite reductase/ring-hydroxylating ferredoxin subunit
VSETPAECPDRDPQPASRRRFLGGASTVALGAGLAASYGTAAWMGVRYLYPAGPRPEAWLFVARLAELGPGASLSDVGPSGERIAVARQGAGDTAEDFVALSSTCPHLGCQVHWEAQNARFFCPCHNGAFDPQGKGIAGPPGEAGQSLPRYPLKVDAGLLYIRVPLGKPA